MNIWEKAKNYATGLRICWDWLGEGGQVVSKAKAQSRADICLACRHNAQGGILPKAVAWAVHEQISFKNDMKLTVEGEKGLGECELCSCQLRLKIWREIDKIRAENSDVVFPAHCFIITEE